MHSPDSCRIKNCIECGHFIPGRANKCIHCSAFQDYRRYIMFGNTFLSLLIALFAVLGIVGPNLLFLLNNDSKLEFKYIKADKDGVHFFCTNSGNRPALIIGGTLSVLNCEELGGCSCKIEMEIISEHTGGLVFAANHGDLLSFKLSYTDDDTCKNLIKKLGYAEWKVCSFELDVINYSGKDGPLPITNDFTGKNTPIRLALLGK